MTNTMTTAVFAVAESSGTVTELLGLNIKLLEGDKRVVAQHGNIGDIDGHVRALEARFGDKADAVITNERYKYITKFIGNVQTRANDEKSTTSKADRVLLNRVLALPIFVVIIAAIY